MAFTDIIVKALVGLALVGFFTLFCLVWLNKRLARDVDRGYSDTFEPRDRFNSSALASASSMSEHDVRDVVVMNSATQQRRLASGGLAT